MKLRFGAGLTRGVDPTGSRYNSTSPCSVGRGRIDQGPVRREAGITRHRLATSAVSLRFVFAAHTSFQQLTSLKFTTEAYGTMTHLAQKQQTHTLRCFSHRRPENQETGCCATTMTPMSCATDPSKRHFSVTEPNRMRWGVSRNHNIKVVFEKNRQMKSKIGTPVTLQPSFVNIQS